MPHYACNIYTKYIFVFEKISIRQWVNKLKYKTSTVLTHWKYRIPMNIIIIILYDKVNVWHICEIQIIQDKKQLCEYDIIFFRWLKRIVGFFMHFEQKNILDFAIWLIHMDNLKELFEQSSY